ncbi:MAG: DUF2846 domain-containing protein [Sphingobium sp.]|jgi:hypothetical protein|nr:DUF2846 domain-containing protein [Sphingobium sp.]MCP5399356.1 DUF2846 domain-containing protein [Sphingomonas sp.]
MPIAIPKPPVGKGQIVFFRPGGMGFALGCSVNENGQKVSSLGAGKYFIMVTDPGRHEFTVQSEAKDVLALEVESDETQYASCKIKMGILVGRPDIRPATEAEFLKATKLKMVDADDMGPAPGALKPEEVTAALAMADTIESVEVPAEEPAPAVEEAQSAEMAVTDTSDDESEVEN